MKKRRFVSISVTLLMAMSVITTFPMSAWASDNYTSVNGGTTTFDKYLVMDNKANVPNVTFTYSISAPENNIAADTTNGKLAILKGVGTPSFKSNDLANTGSNTAGEVKFIPTDSTIAEKDVNTHKDTVSFSTTDDITDEKYAKKTLTIDFSSVTFTEPGVYRYIIAESGTNQGVTNDTTLKRTLDVYVEDAKAWYDAQTDKTDLIDPGNTKQLKVTGYVMYSDDITTAPGSEGTPAGTKSSSYTNTYNTHDLTFSKTVTGNQGSKDKYFKFTVTIDNLTQGTILDVDLTNADSTEIKASPNVATTVITSNYTNPAQLVANTTTSSYTVGDGTTESTKKITATYYLQHGQSIKIMGIPDGASYTIKEGYEDYTPSVAIKAPEEDSNNWDNISGEQGTNLIAGSNDSINKEYSVSDSVIKADAQADFTNNRSGFIPTGIILSVAPTAIIGLIVIGGIVFLIIRNKKRKYEE